MKTTHTAEKPFHTFNATDPKTGDKFQWAFRSIHAVNCTLGEKPRRVSGWELKTNDGCVRFLEGNWVDFVPFVKLIAGNYGLETHIS